MKILKAASAIVLTLVLALGAAGCSNGGSDDSVVMLPTGNTGSTGDTGSTGNTGSTPTQPGNPDLGNGDNVDNKKTLASIELATENVKKTYTTSDFLDLTNLKVTARYSDGSSEVVTKDYRVSPVSHGMNFDGPGVKTITVEYGDSIIGIKSETFKVTVLDNSVPDSIEVDTSNMKLEYFEGETLDLNNLVIKGNYPDGGSHSATGYYTVNPANGTKLETLGENTVTVTLGDKTATFIVKVIKQKGQLSNVTVKVPEYDNRLTLKEYSYGFEPSYEGKSYTWWLDGVKTDNTNRIFVTQGIAQGYHELTAVVTISDGKSYSASTTFTIE